MFEASIECKVLLKIFIVYWIIGYILLFLWGYLCLYGIIAINAAFMVAINIVNILVLFAISVLLLKLSNIELNLQFYGLSKNNTHESIIMGGIAGAPFTVMSAIFLLYLGNAAKDYAKYSVPTWLQTLEGYSMALTAIVFWLLNGIISIALLQAFSYEILGNITTKKKAIIIITILWAGIYNGIAFSIITGTPLGVSMAGEIIDIIYLGIIFMYLYTKTRNSIGLILAYVFAYEAPVKAAILLGLGTWALFTMNIICLIWSLASIIVYTKKNKQ